MTPVRRALIGGALIVAVCSAWLPVFLMQWAPPDEWQIPMLVASALVVASVPWIVYRRAANLFASALRFLTAIAVVATLLLLGQDLIYTANPELTAYQATTYAWYAVLPVILVWGMGSVRSKHSYAVEIGRWAILMVSLLLTLGSMIGMGVLSETLGGFLVVTTVVGLTALYGFRIGVRWEQGHRGETPVSEGPPLGEASASTA